MSVFNSYYRLFEYSDFHSIFWDLVYDGSEIGWKLT